MSKPSLVIVPGSFTGPEFYDTLSSILQKSHGYEVIVGALQSASRGPGEKPATLHEDAAYFRGIITALAAQGKDVVIIGHSYGGIVASQAAQSVTKTEARGAGVVRVVYLASPLSEVGQAPLEAMGGQLGPNIKIMVVSLLATSCIQELILPGRLHAHPPRACRPPLLPRHA